MDEREERWFCLNYVWLGVVGEGENSGLPIDVGVKVTEEGVSKNQWKRCRYNFHQKSEELSVICPAEEVDRVDVLEVFACFSEDLMF